MEGKVARPNGHSNVRPFHRCARVGRCLWGGAAGGVCGRANLCGGGQQTTSGESVGLTNQAAVQSERGCEGKMSSASEWLVNACTTMADSDLFLHVFMGRGNGQKTFGEPVVKVVIADSREKAISCGLPTSALFRGWESVLSHWAEAVKTDPECQASHGMEVNILHSFQDADGKLS